jgi:Flp pilus assembly pilin Flp
MLELMRNFWTDESGQDLAEYALLIALIAIVSVGVILTFGGQIATIFENITGGLQEAAGAGEAGGGGE